MEEVVIVTRDINGKRTTHHLWWNDVLLNYIEETFTDEDEILLVIVEDTCIYSGLTEDPITTEDLIGFFA